MAQLNTLAPTLWILSSPELDFSCMNISFEVPEKKIQNSKFDIFVCNLLYKIQVWKKCFLVWRETTHIYIHEFIHIRISAENMNKETR